MKFKETQTPRKLRGGYYTHPEIAAFLAKWVMEIHPTSVLEPSCGDGVFLDALAASSPNGLQSITCCEIDPRESALARLKGNLLSGATLEVHNIDFLGWSLSNGNDGCVFDAVVGNPPFVRYQYLSSEQQDLARRIFERSSLPFTKHTNAWVPFIVASLNLLRPGGRLAMVLPSELLHVSHAKPLRRLLIKHCSRILIVDPTDLWFDRVLQGVVLILAEKKLATEDTSHGVGIFASRDRKILHQSPSALFDQVEWVTEDELNGKWMAALLSKKERSVIKELRQRPHVLPFGRIARVDVGIVTGANEFFLVPDSVVEAYGLRAWAHPMFGRASHVRGVIYDEDSHAYNARQGLPTNFLWFNGWDVGNLPPLVHRYIERGEAQGLHQRYKCRIRNPWYTVPSVSSSPVGLLKRCHQFPRLILNKAKAFTTDTCYRIFPFGVPGEQLVGAFVNSLTALTAELEGRHYGGGVLELVPSEIETLLVPVGPSEKSTLDGLDDSLRRGLPAEEVLRKQDAAVLKPIGLTQDNCDDLLSAWRRLRSRRHRTQGDEEEC